MSDDRRPTSDDWRPMSDDRRPMSDDRRPMIDDRRPMSDDRRPMIDDRRPMSDDRRPMIDDWRPRCRPGANSQPSSPNVIQNPCKQQPPLYKFVFGSVGLRPNARGGGGGHSNICPV